MVQHFNWLHMMLAYHISGTVQVPAAPVPIQLPTNALGKAVEGQNIWDPVTYVTGTDRSPGFLIQLGPNLGTVGFGEVIH